ncbi:hypothetical protein [Pelomonas cellulosilytica]|uniref:Phosphate ABC transporter substrate-binding protein n=1 Tax=Pelomonas cellulosilytica TaxID=2906762 RepID=A0ABS8XXP0_9BURK|nr:hypothetical protein [Pelomonas sp. P8]MCE4556045.1 hypothetical protein [Pelomonas sp. P8]
MLRTLLAAALLALASPAWADFFVVVHASNPQRSLTQKQAVDLFMGRSRAFANGEFALIFDLPRDNPRRTAFYEALTGLSVAQVNSYWSRLMFSGQSVPPQALPDEAAMAGVLRRNPSALGWLSKEPGDPGLRTVLVIREAAAK